MWALEGAYDARQPAVVSGTPILQVTVLAAIAGLALAARNLGGMPPRLATLVIVAAGHGILLTTALGWASFDAYGPTGGPSLRSVSAIAVSLLALGAAASAFAPWGGAVYITVPAWLVLVRARSGLALPGPGERPMVFIGAALGAAVGVHLVVTASRTLGYQLQVGGVAALIGAVGYDLGANVLSAECFFRGALFQRAYRRRSFRAAVAVSTVAYVARYLVDPLLPKAAELVIGTIVYVGALGIVNCWLLRWSGSLVPGYVGAVLFFTAYRLLRHG
jgi:hypothetical protein